MADRKGSSSEKTLYCSFCGKSQHEVKKLIAGPSVFICDECIDLCNEIIRDELPAGDEQREARGDLPTPAEIKGNLDNYVTAEAAGASPSGYPLQRLLQEIPRHAPALPDRPDGSGKTLRRKRSRACRRSFVMADATTLTEAGYVGETSRTSSRSAAKRNYEVERAQRGIVHDEIDKISRKSDNSLDHPRCSGEGAAGVAAIEGIMASAPQGGRKHPNRTSQIDTTNILFIWWRRLAGLE